MPDLIRRCAECRIEFIWMEDEQSSSGGQQPPVFCPMCRRLLPAGGRRRGLIKWFNHSKSYGFITPAEGPELFAHKSGLVAGQPLPRAGQLVEYVVRAGPRGLQAEEMVLLEVDELPATDAP